MSGVFSCSGASRAWRPGGRINSSKGSSSLQPLPSLDPSLTLNLTSSLPRLTSRGPSVTQRALCRRGGNLGDGKPVCLQGLQRRLGGSPVSPG